MSTIVMSACWPLQMPPTPKAVLMSLADNANDHGDCWPSIAKVCERTCFGKTAVIQAIGWLEAHSALSTDKSNGRHTSYTITPEKYGKPDHEADRCVSRTGAPAEPKPVRLPNNRTASRTQPVREADTNRKEPSLRATVKSNRKSAPACAVACPDDVDPQTWSDWLSLRKAKKAPVTETVLREAVREAAKARLPLGRFLEIWCSRGSQGLQADWLKPHERAGPANGKPSASADFRNTTYTGTALDDLPEDLRIPEPA